MWSLPFGLILIGVAAFPFFWNEEAEETKKMFVQYAYFLLLGGIVAVHYFQINEATEIQKTLEEYLQFIVLLFGLYCVSGGIAIKGNLPPKPINNLSILFFGTLISSFVGTTGASVLLINLVCATNSTRQFNKHIVMFFIWTISNCAGLLFFTGDPPLLIGKLMGMPVTWTFSLFPQWLLVNEMLLYAFFCIDSYFWKKEKEYAPASKNPLQSLISDIKMLRLVGAKNVILLLGIILVSVFLSAPYKELVMLVLAGLSFTGNQESREINKFGFGSITEVAILFVAIFVAMIPAIEIVRNSASLVTVNPATLIIASGSLSSFLDNAPTFAIFANLAQTVDFPGVIVPGIEIADPLLTAISLGSVMCGAITLIGNAPNMVVVSIAKKRGLKVPHFFEYAFASLAFVGYSVVTMFNVFLVGGNFFVGMGMLVTWLVSMTLFARK